ncbi:MAG TPA: GNAT family N-acetyltransferase, partial [Kofleriaceae bacterium]|nr:GNAT family N-acetyltransferase [Kofleriaceae bacterium]
MIGQTVARRIETAEASFTADVGDAVQRRRGIDVIVARIGGGVGVFYGDSPFDKIIGLGFETLDTVDLERFEHAVGVRGGQVQVELSTLADPTLAAGLTARGYLLCGFENVLGRSVEGAMDTSTTDNAIAVLPPDDTASWIATVARASADPDHFDGPASHESFSDETIAAVLRDMTSLDGFRMFVAKIADDVVGGASMRIHDGIAQLTGAATLRAYRRRGVQRALLRSRLALAAQAGCDLAIVT